MDAETLARQIEFEDQGLELVGDLSLAPDRATDAPRRPTWRMAYYPDGVYVICSLSDAVRPTRAGIRDRDGGRARCRSCLGQGRMTTVNFTTIVLTNWPRHELHCAQ